MNKPLKILIPIIAGVLILVFIFNKRERENNQPVNKNEYVINQNNDSLTKTKEDNSNKKKLTYDLNKQETKQQDTLTNIDDSTIIEKNENLGRYIYINEEIGLTFKYKGYWIKDTNEIKLTDLNGKIKSIEIHFADTVTNSDLLVRYHPNPGGTKLYNYMLSQYEKSEGNYQFEKREIIIDGYKAILGSSIRKIDGRGHKINPPIKLTIIDMLCDKLSGKLELQFKTQAGNKIAEDDFSKLINTIKIIK